MNKRCVALTDEQYRESISLLRSGFVLDEKFIKPNERIAAVEVLQATLGLRLGDTLKLRMSSFIKDGNRYRLDIKEQKTGKMRTFTVPIEVYSFIQDYAISNNIGADAKLFDISERQVERHMNKVFTKMGFLDIFDDAVNKYESDLKQDCYFFEFDGCMLYVHCSGVATRKRSRITPVIRKLEEVWREHPDLRLGQLLIDCAGDKDLFNLEDDELLEALERFGDENDFERVL